MREMVINTLRELCERSERYSYQDIIYLLEEKVSAGEFPQALFETICVCNECTVRE